MIGLDPGHQLHQDSGLEPVAPGSSDIKMKVSSGTQGVKSRVEEQAVNLNKMHAQQFVFAVAY